MRNTGIFKLANNYEINNDTDVMNAEGLLGVLADLKATIGEYYDSIMNAVRCEHTDAIWPVDNAIVNLKNSITAYKMRQTPKVEDK